MSVSILFRTKAWLTLHQLVHGWAGELPGAEKDPKGFQQNLAHLLLEDIANGRLDDAGPLVEGQRLGLRLISPGCQVGFLEGRQILDALRSGDDAEFLGHRIVVMKEASLAFAQRHDLPSPSWWQNDTTALPTTAPDDIIGTAGSNSAKAIEKPAKEAQPQSRGRKPKKLNRTKEAMRDDIQKGRLTPPRLEEMTEIELSAKYVACREIVRKARNAVLPEFLDQTLATKTDY
jgi:hypothetical protein